MKLREALLSFIVVVTNAAIMVNTSCPLLSAAAKQIAQPLKGVLHTVGRTTLSGRDITAFAILVALMLVVSAFIRRLSRIFAIRFAVTAETLLPTAATPGGYTRPTLAIKPRPVTDSDGKFVTGGGRHRSEASRFPTVYFIRPVTIGTSLVTLWRDTVLPGEVLRYHKYRYHYHHQHVHDIQQSTRCGSETAPPPIATASTITITRKW
ncbi:hypothetical protein P691DRAFT_771720 [Macrolepiota fuliginosa MF-IS2]|uniref:Uncharacterized protein n=1 Tax=Macrolepiota fuliginosa MF-IS2 TaxID=1400762 RepID=A0A9P5XLR7_9AGAR|nr:hypothetical protein P691DRAFT_771720 [Macrolepiota fuliginosa MF-IS2]